MAYNDMDVLLCCLAGLSAMCSLFTVVSYLSFKELRKLRFLEFVFYVSLNDFIASFALGLFAVYRGEWQCWMQGFFTNANYVSSAIWTVIITYQLYLVVTRGKIISDTIYFHIFGWVVPLVAALLPLTTNTYGEPDKSYSRHTVHWCFIANTNRSFEYSLVVWEILSFYLWIWAAILFMLYIVVYVNIKVSSMQFVSVSLQTSVRKLYLYPIIFIVSWILPSICDIFEASTSEKYLDAKFLTVSNFFPALQGFFLFIVVIWKNPLIRDCWMARFRMWTGKLSLCYSQLWKNSKSGHANEARNESSPNMSINIIRHQTDIPHDLSEVYNAYRDEMKSIHVKIEQEGDHIEGKSIIDTLRDSIGALKLYSNNSSNNSSSSNGSSSNSKGNSIPEQFTDVKLSAMYEMKSSINSSARVTTSGGASERDKSPTSNADNIESSAWTKYDSSEEA